MGVGEALVAVDDELVVLARGDGRVLGGEADVEAADAEVRVLDVEVVGVAHRTVLEDGDVDLACKRFCQLFTTSAINEICLRVSLTIRPCIDRMGAVAGDGRVQFLPQDVEFVLQVDEKDVGVARRTPRVAAHAGVAVVPVEYLLLRPRVIAIGPAHGVESGRVDGVP